MYKCTLYMWCIVTLCEAKLPFTNTFQFVDLCNKNSTNMHETYRKYSLLNNSSLIV